MFKYFLNFTKISNKFDKFFNILGFTKILSDIKAILVLQVVCMSQLEINDDKNFKSILVLKEGTIGYLK